MSMSDKLNEAVWRQPPAEWRDVPFWSWNGRLDEARLRRQLREMVHGGMGGVFPHSRYGLRQPYLAEPWWEAIRVCLDEARAAGVKVYIYDEDRWPSGTAAGMVTVAHPEFGSRFLERSSPGVMPSTAPEQWAFRVVLDAEGRLGAYHPASAAAGAEGQLEIYRVRLEEPSAWYNGGAYLDTLNPAAVDAFLAITHEAYAQRFGDDFGSLIPAFFMDETHYGTCGGRNKVHWSAVLEAEFLRRRGYALTAHLPELFHELSGGRFSRVRHDFRRTLTELFVINFTGRVAAWCERHGVALTGHLLEEETLSRQIANIGAAMPHYALMQWPGIDILGEAGSEKLVMTKQCTSVADQLGKERCLSELYAATGWNFTLEGHKYVGDWHVVCGVNFRCLHLVHYTLAGAGKRDWLPSHGPVNSWWCDHDVVAGYFARLQSWLSQGRPIRDVLVIHPIETAWGFAVPRDGWCEDVVETDQYALHNLGMALCGAHWDWDFGDEELLAQHGRADAGTFTVGRMNYRVVVAPPCTTLRASTVRLLESFADSGGILLFMGRSPDHVDGVPDSRAGALAGKARSRCPNPEAVVEALEATALRRLSIAENGCEVAPCWSMLRDVDGGQILFVQSHDRKASHTVEVRVRGAAPVVAWDALSGERRRLESKAVGGFVTFQLQLPATGSALVALGLPVPAGTVEKAAETTLEVRDYNGPFPIGRTEPNSLPLDFCRFRVNDKPYGEVTPVFAADDAIRAAFGLTPRRIEGVQPWALYGRQPQPLPNLGRFGLSWSFHVTGRPSKCRLALEGAGLGASLCVNGTSLPWRADGWWVDEDFQTCEIAALLREGTNRIDLEDDFRADRDIEAAYLVGEFGVAWLNPAQRRTWDNVTLVEAPCELALGSWVGQKLDFYGGAVRYEVRVEAPAGAAGVWIELTDLRAMAAAIEVADVRRPLPWPPYAAFVPREELEAANGLVVVELMGGRRNTLGSAHVEGRGADESSFNPHSAGWTDEYRLWDQGLMGPVRVTAVKRSA